MNANCTNRFSSGNVILNSTVNVPAPSTFAAS